MNYTFSRVAAFCGLRLAYYSTAALLSLAFLALALTGYGTPTPLYILLMVAVLPSLLKSMLSSVPKREKRENAMAFPLFCKKYRYDAAMYRAMNLAYLLLFILFAAWQFSYRVSEGLPALLTSLPALLAAVSLLLRLFGVIGYRLYFHLFPLEAMH